MKVQIHILFGSIHWALFAVYHDDGVTDMNRGLRILQWWWHLLRDSAVWLMRWLSSGTFELYPNASVGALALLWFREGAVMWNSLHCIRLVSNPNSSAWDSNQITRPSQLIAWTLTTSISLRGFYLLTPRTIAVKTVLWQVRVNRNGRSIIAIKPSPQLLCGLRVKTRGVGGKGFYSHPTDKASSYWRNLPLSSEIRKTSPSLESGQHKLNAVCCSFMWNSLLIPLNFCQCV